MRRWLLALVAVAGPLAVARDAAAADGDPLDRDPFRLDVFQGPVLGSSRAVGLSGAFVSIAEGVEGLLWNPAAVANRYPYSLDWWDWDLDGGLLFPTGALGTDYDNDGRTSTDYDDFRVGLVGGALQFGYLGFGLEGTVQSYTVDVDLGEGSRPVDVTVTTLHADVAFALLHGQLVVGGGARLLFFGFRENETLLGTGARIEGLDDRSGVGAEVGVLVRPDDQPFRFAAVGRTDVSDASANCTVQAPDVEPFLPCEVVLPWEMEIGFSWMFGPRPYNFPWRNPRLERVNLLAALEQRREARWRTQQLQLAQMPPTLWAQENARIQEQERRTQELEDREMIRTLRQRAKLREHAYKRAPRQYLLVSADLVMTGPVDEAHGVEAFVRQEQQRSGEDLSWTPRLGLEAEPWHDRLKLRAGSYLEPSRFRDRGPRPHGTFGLDVRLFYTTLFGLLPEFGVRASGVIDIAPRYLQFAVSIGNWH